MGPLLMTGLNIFGATVGVGLVAARMRPLAAPAAEPPTPRNLAMTAIAFCSGIGVLGAVVGILAIEYGLASDPAGPIAAIVPALLGAVIGLAIVARHWSETDRTVASIGVLFIGSQAVLAVVVGTLSVVLRESAGAALNPWLFAALGTVAAGSTIALGLTGARGVETMAAAPTADARRVMSRQMTRIVPFEIVGVVATFAAIALVVGAAR